VSLVADINPQDVQDDPTQPAAPSVPQLGSFGTAPTSVVVTQPRYGSVDYFGVPIRVVADSELLEIDLEEFMAAATQMDAQDMQALGAVHHFLRRMVHPDDFRKFWDAVRQNRQGIEQQMEFARYLVEAATGHPTDGPSDSSAGPSATAPSSEDDLSSRAQRNLEGSGRPDLAVAVIQRREFLSAQPVTTG